MEVAEAEIGEGRGVSEALEDAVEVAGVAEVPEAEGRSVLALESQQARLPAHLQPVVVVVVVLVVAVGQLQGHQRRKRRRLLRRPPSSPPSAPALARALHGGGAAPRWPLALIADPRGPDRAARIAPGGPRPAAPRPPPRRRRLVDTKRVLNLSRSLRREGRRGGTVRSFLQASRG